MGSICVEWILNGVGELGTILTTLNHGLESKNSMGGSQLLQIQMFKEGIKFITCSRAKDVYTETTFAHTFFDYFSYKSEENKFDKIDCLVSLPTFLHSLMLFGLQAHIRWNYSLETKKIVFTLHGDEENFGVMWDKTTQTNIYSECVIDTFDMSQEDSLIDIQSSLSEYKEVDYFRIMPNILREVIMEFNEEEQDGKVMIAIEPHEHNSRDPILYMGMVQQLTSSQWNFPYHPVLFREFDVKQPQKWTFRLKNLMMMTPALKVADGVKVTFYPNGLMTVQLIFRTKMREKLNMIFYVAPNDSNDY